MKLASLMFASLLVLVFGIFTLACGSMAVAQTRTPAVMSAHDIDLADDASR